MQPSRDEFHHRSPTPDPRGMPKRPRTRNSIDPYLYINQINAGFQIACPEIGRRRHRFVFYLCDLAFLLPLAKRLSTSLA